MRRTRGVRYLLKDIGRGLIRAVEDDVKLLPFLHLLEQRPRVLISRRKLADFDLDAVSGRGFDELLETY